MYWPTRIFELILQNFDFAQKFLWKFKPENSNFACVENGQLFWTQDFFHNKMNALLALYSYLSFYIYAANIFLSLSKINE